MLKEYLQIKFSFFTLLHFFDKIKVGSPLIELLRYCIFLPFFKRHLNVRGKLKIKKDENDFVLSFLFQEEYQM